jgi:hypothetical protein
MKKSTKSSKPNQPTGQKAIPKRKPGWDVSTLLFLISSSNFLPAGDHQWPEWAQAVKIKNGWKADAITITFQREMDWLRQFCEEYNLSCLPVGEENAADNSNNTVLGSLFLVDLIFANSNRVGIPERPVIDSSRKSFASTAENAKVPEAMSEFWNIHYCFLMHSVPRSPLGKRWRLMICADAAPVVLNCFLRLQKRICRANKSVTD